MADENFSIEFGGVRVPVRMGSGASQTAATRAETAQAAAEVARDEAIAAPLTPTVEALAQAVDSGVASLSGALDYVAGSVVLDFTTGYFRAGLASASSLSALGIATVTQAAQRWWKNDAGALVQYAANTPLASAHGWLIEGANKNRLLQSRTIDTVGLGWTGTNMTFTANAIAAPDGTTSADLLTRTSTAAAYRQQNRTKAASALPYSGVHWVKASVGDYCAIRIQGTYPARADATFRFSTGAFTSGPTASGAFTNAKAYATEYPNGWWRLEISATTDTATTISSFVSFNSNGVSVDGTDSASNSAGYVWENAVDDRAKTGGFLTTTTTEATLTATGAVLAIGPGPDDDVITVIYGEGSANSQTATFTRGTLADPQQIDMTTDGGAPWINFPIRSITLAPAAAGQEQNVSALRDAVRTQGFFPRPAAALAAGDTPTLTLNSSGANSTIDGASPDSPRVPRTSAMLTYVSGPPISRGTVYPQYNYFTSRGAYLGTSNGTDPLRGSSGYFAYEFVHTGSVFEIPMYASGATGVNVRVLVNGFVAGTFSVPAATGGRHLGKVQFPGSATRTIRIETIGIPCNGVHVASLSEVASVGRSYPLVTLIGDSFFDGTGMAVGDSLPSVAGRALGFNMAIAGAGGTGLLNTGGNNTSGYPKVAFTHAERLKDLTLSGVTSAQTGLAAVPAMGLVAASLNDEGVASGVWSPFGATLMDAIINRADVLIDAWLAANPGKPLVWLGPTWPSGQPNNRPTLNLYRIRDGVQRAVAMRSADNVWFIDRLMPALREGVYSTATDQAALYTGGTTGTDATHPTPAGHCFDGLWLADQLRRLILTQFA